MPEIRLEELSKSFDGTVAADGMNLTVKDGEYLCILGPTGSGKTTCMRMICGLTVPDSGRIFFNDEDITDKPSDAREATMLSQTYALFPKMTVAENVGFAPKIKNWPENDAEQIVKSMLDMVGMSHKRDWMPKNLSGGQQQRTALARAMASGSKVLLLDEPLRALDARLRLNLRKELRSLVKGMELTCIHVTHDQDEALEMADRIAIIRNGKIIQVGTPEEIFNEPNSPFVANFVGRSNILRGTVVSKGDVSVAELADGTRVEVRSTDLEIGSKVLVTVKMGKTRFVQEDKAEAENVNTFLRGKIERILYEGATITAEARVEGIGIVSSKMPNRKYDMYEVGEEILIYWIPHNAILFEDTGSDEDSEVF
ncbi:MAG: ABC transporter ATP-binding protein [Candidatus Methanomethylophilaceae archaeon]|jgi:ABC-type Fe3+/spermidine/putrescine transport system ATPase subunit